MPFVSCASLDRLMFADRAATGVSTLDGNIDSCLDILVFANPLTPRPGEILSCNRLCVQLFFTRRRYGCTAHAHSHDAKSMRFMSIMLSPMGSGKGLVWLSSVTHAGRIPRVDSRTPNTRTASSCDGPNSPCACMRSLGRLASP